MKVFYGKWILCASEEHAAAETCGTRPHYQLVFYRVEDNNLVIQSLATGKYLQPIEPLIMTPFGGPPPWTMRACYTPFVATAEFDAAFRFSVEGDFGYSPGWVYTPRIGLNQEQAKLYQLCVFVPTPPSGEEPYVELGLRMTLTQAEKDAHYDPCSVDPLAQYLKDLLDWPFLRLTVYPVELRRADPIGWLDWSGVDLSGQDLSNLNLAHADLRGANLSDATVSRLGLSGAKMEGADLSNVDATGIHYEPASPPSIYGSEGNLTCFKGATVPLSLIEKDWSYLNLDGANIPEIKPGLDLKQLKACHANLSNLDLSELLLDGVDFSHATIKNTVFNGSRLTKAKFDDAVLYNTKLISCNLDSASFIRAQMGSLEKEMATNFNYSYLPNVKLGYANLYNAQMEGVTMFGGETIIGDHAILDGVLLSDAYLVEVQFLSIEMRGASLQNSCLVRAKFAGCDLSPLAGRASTFARACLQGTVFSKDRDGNKVKLDGADFSQAAISFDKGHLLVQYRDEYGNLSEEMPHKYTPTSLLELEDLPPSMTCPNGKTVKMNKRENISLREMMTHKDAPTKWVAPDKTG